MGSGTRMLNRKQRGLTHRARTTGKAALLVAVEHDRGITHDEPRPRTRGECAGGVRPCPWVSCRHHLAIEVTSAGAIKVNFPHMDTWDMRETCALDVADAGEHTLDEVGDLLNITRERARQLESMALLEVQAKGVTTETNDV